jgi:hypothetical protein
MTVRSIEPQSEGPAPANPAAQETSVQRQETVVVHRRDQDSSERTSVGGPTGSLAEHAPAPLATASSRTVVRDEVGGTERRVAQIRQIIWFVVGFLEVALALRLVFKLLGAGQTADFTQTVFGFTTPFVTPFFGIFPSGVAAGYEFEPATAVAMVVYLLAGLGLARLVRILYGETRETA